MQHVMIHSCRMSVFGLSPSYLDGLLAHWGKGDLGAGEPRTVSANLACSDAVDGKLGLGEYGTFLEGREIGPFSLFFVVINHFAT